jgi:hypothetical protein
VPSFPDGIVILRTNGKVVRKLGKPERGDVVRVAWQPRR